jgi:hypothetical protein
MSTLNIGTPIQTYTLWMRRRSPQGYVINWFSDDGLSSPMNSIDGKTMKIVIGPRDAPHKQYEAICTLNKSTFSLSPDDTDLPFDQYDGMILVSDAGVDTALVNLQIMVGPS